MGARVSLRKALATLPDDREAVSATREILAFFASHADEYVSTERVARATRVSPHRVELILGTLVDTFVLDCGGSGEREYRYAPDSLLALEMKRYLQTSAVPNSSLQRGTDRFRSRYGGAR
jgi:hypothetical protein